MMTEPTDSPPTIKLKRLEVKNFKCLKNISLSFDSPLIVLVGKNNSGKSTVLDIFDFIRDASINASDAVTKRASDATKLLWAQLADTIAIITVIFTVPDELR